MTRGRLATFPEIAGPEIVGKAVRLGADPSILPFDPRRFVVRLEGGGEAVVDLSAWSRPSLAAAFAPLLQEHVRRMGPTPLTRSIRRQTLALRRFWLFLEETGAPLGEIRGVTVALINSYEDWLEQNAGDRLQQRHLIASVIALLRLATELQPDLLPLETLSRLTYLGHGQSGSSRPRDAYSSGVAAALRKAARAQMADAWRRIAIADALPTPIPGVDASARLRAHHDAVTGEIARAGQIGTQHPLYKRFINLAMFWEVRQPLERLHAGFHLTRIDLIGFIVLLSLETGMEMECLFGLKAECLRNPSRGYVEIEYYKRRARGSEWKRLRVRDGGSSTPGGLVRLAIKLTERARTHIGTDRLWVIWTIVGLRIPREEGAEGVAAFVVHHGLTGDDGEPLKLRLSQLRKTQKAEWYKRTGGQLENFAVGHSISVAARHYADIPALRHVHEQTLAAAFQDALDAALQPRIVPPKLETEMRGMPDTAGLPVPSGKVRALLDGEQDVWLASCGGFYSSPFGTAGDACPTPFWGCLDCRNAVITARKLPALIAFQSFIREQRAALTADDWAMKFGRAYRRITEQILPAFPMETVVEARAAATLMGSALLYLPPEASAT